jgi:hypothetical protein
MSKPDAPQTTPEYDDGRIWDELTQMALDEMARRRAEEHEQWLEKMRAVGLIP